jgi:hypothetical protein
MPQSLRRRIFASLLGSKELFEDEQRLLIVHAQGTGGMAIILLLWLMAWSFGVVELGRDVLAKPQLRGILVWALMLAIAIFILIYALWAWWGRDELHVDSRGVHYSRRLLVRLWGTSIATRDVDAIDLTAIDNKPNDLAIEIKGRSRTIHFGRGMPPSSLLLYARKITERAEKVAGRALPAAQMLEQVDVQEWARRTRVLQGALAAEGVMSAAEIEADPAQKKAVFERMVSLYVEEMSRSGSRGR